MKHRERITRPVFDVTPIENPTEQYLEKLYRDSLALEKRPVGSRDPKLDVRPVTISYPGGTHIVLERVRNHLSDFNDTVTVQTTNGSFILNEVAGYPVTFVDTSLRPSFGARDIGPGERDFFVYYCSKLLKKSERNLYALLHELCHPKHHFTGVEKPVREARIWDEADLLLAKMGLIPFENETERQLFRDVHIRTYDPFGKAKVIKIGLMSRIKQDRFSFEVLEGLIRASESGQNLEVLCRRLLEEKERGG